MFFAYLWFNFGNSSLGNPPDLDRLLFFGNSLIMVFKLICIFIDKVQVHLEVEVYLQVHTLHTW